MRFIRRFGYAVWRCLQFLCRVTTVQRSCCCIAAIREHSDFTLLDLPKSAEQTKENMGQPFMKLFCNLRCCQWAGYAFCLLALSILTGCASPITAKVTRFNQWPTDTSNAVFSFIRPVDGLNDLEQQAYESKVQYELEKLGLKRAALGQVGRIQVDVVTGNSTRNKQFREPIYRDNYVYHPPFRDAAGNLFAGFWAPDRFGQRYVGDRTVTRTVQVSQLRLRLLDSQGSPSGKPRAIFEGRAIYEGENEDLTTLVPFLVRAVFDEFPGQNGKVQTIKFDSKTGAATKN